MNYKPVLAAAAIFAIASFTSANATPTGVYKAYHEGTKSLASYISMTKSGNALRGKILCTFKRNGSRGDPNARCEKGTCKGKKWLGLTILWDVKQKSRNEYVDGKVLRAKDGKVYGLDIKVLNGGKRLQLNGYRKMLGAKIGGKPAYFDKVSNATRIKCP